MASANATRIASTAACARAISVVASVVAVNASNTFIAKSAATPWLGGGSSHTVTASRNVVATGSGKLVACVARSSSDNTPPRDRTASTMASATGPV